MLNFRIVKEEKEKELVIAYFEDFILRRRQPNAFNMTREMLNETFFASPARKKKIDHYPKKSYGQSDRRARKRI